MHRLPPLVSLSTGTLKTAGSIFKRAPRSPAQRRGSLNAVYTNQLSAELEGLLDTLAVSMEDAKSKSPLGTYTLKQMSVALDALREVYLRRVDGHAVLPPETPTRNQFRVNVRTAILCRFPHLKYVETDLSGFSAMTMELKQCLLIDIYVHLLVPLDGPANKTFRKAFKDADRALALELVSLSGNTLAWVHDSFRTDPGFKETAMQTASSIEKGLQGVVLDMQSLAL